MRKSKGFTLIELLVVIAIIGILAALVLVALNSARQKANDARMQSDCRNIQLALEMFYDDNSQAYPLTAAGVAAASAYFTNGTVPTEPDGDAYSYASSDGSSYCLSFGCEQCSAPDNEFGSCPQT